MRFKEAYEGCKSGHLTHVEAALLLGVCDRTFRRYMVKYDEGHGFGHEANSIELYKYMMGFFAQYLK